MTLNKNDIINLKIIDLSTEGFGVGKHEGMTVFVPLTAIGDEVSAKIIKVMKSYAYGKMEELIVTSADRVQNDCPAFSKCGGCSYRHIDYKKELEIKANQVVENIRRIGTIELAIDKIIPSEKINRYRNKAQYPVRYDIDGKIIAGFFARNSHRVVLCDDCMLQPEIFSKIVDFIVEYMTANKIQPYIEETGKGLIRHIFLRQSRLSGEIMLCLVINSNSTSKVEDLVIKVALEFLEIKTATINHNTMKNNVILGEKTSNIFGDGFIIDELCGLNFKISPPSFFQVNNESATLIYNIVKDYAGLTGNETLFDLYCGAGTIGLTLAEKAKKVIGVEIVKEAIEDAIYNAKINKIENCEFFCGDAGLITAKLKKEGVTADIIVLDPPRKGLNEELINLCIDMQPKKVVMVSCNSSTLARDLKLFKQGGYEAKKLSVVDMFPRTPHVECCVLIEPK